MPVVDHRSRITLEDLRGRLRLWLDQGFQSLIRFSAEIVTDVDPVYMMERSDKVFEAAATVSVCARLLAISDSTVVLRYRENPDVITAVAVRARMPLGSIQIGPTQDAEWRVIKSLRVLAQDEVERKSRTTDFSSSPAANLTQRMVLAKWSQVLIMIKDRTAELETGRS